MAYVTPGTVAAGDVATAAAWNVIANDVINLRALANVVQGRSSSSITSSSSTYADVGLTATITPTANTSSVLVTVTLAYYKQNNTALNIRLVRSATTINTHTLVGYTGSALEFHDVYSLTYLDSPATTSATAYKLQFASQGNNALVGIADSGASGTESFIQLREIPA